LNCRKVGKELNNGNANESRPRVHRRNRHRGGKRWKGQRRSSETTSEGKAPKGARYWRETQRDDLQRSLGKGEPYAVDSVQKILILPSAEKRKREKDSPRKKGAGKSRNGGCQQKKKRFTP